MPLSLKSHLKKFVHKGQITQEEYDSLVKKLDGHDKEIRAKAIEEFAEKCKELVKQGELYDYVRWCNWNNSIFKWFDRVAEQLKGE